jgi:hypothetical protein
MLYLVVSLHLLSVGTHSQTVESLGRGREREENKSRFDSRSNIPEHYLLRADIGVSVELPWFPTAQISVFPSAGERHQAPIAPEVLAGWHHDIGTPLKSGCHFQSLPTSGPPAARPAPLRDGAPNLNVCRSRVRSPPSP